MNRFPINIVRGALDSSDQRMRERIVAEHRRQERGLRMNNVALVAMAITCGVVAALVISAA